MVVAYVCSYAPTVVTQIYAFTKESTIGIKVVWWGFGPKDNRLIIHQGTYLSQINTKVLTKTLSCPKTINFMKMYVWKKLLKVLKKMLMNGL